MALVKTFAALIALGVIAAAGFAVFAWRSAIDPISAPATASFDRAFVARGAKLAALGNCDTCHTAAGGRAFAGGTGVQTPFGTIYATNITPDAETGIGTWSAAAFSRAMREGVDREGRHLYPAFPYDHFTLLRDDDVQVLYAYLMTREPVRASAPANELAFPFNLRPLIAAWKLLFLRARPYQPDPSRGSEWNRGAYLVEGLSHCGACHTPRNALGAEKRSEALAGGEAEGWTAYALDRSSPAPVPWNKEALAFYLRNGWQRDHGIARGPMAPVIDNLAPLPDTDLAAIATYVSDIMGEPSEERRRAGEAILERARSGRDHDSISVDAQPTGLTAAEQAPGARIFRSVCAPCHDSGRPLPFGGIDLSLSTGPSGPTACNLINVVLWGLPPAQGERSPVMPGFADELNDAQLGDLLNYARARFGNKPAWSSIADDIHAARNGHVAVYPAHGFDPSNAMFSKQEAR
jgi:mono/diheme cytochrome c family protein